MPVPSREDTAFTLEISQDGTAQLLFLMKFRSVSKAREIFDHHNFDHIHSGLLWRLPLSF